MAAVPKANVETDKGYDDAEDAEDEYIATQIVDIGTCPVNINYDFMNVQPNISGSSKPQTGKCKVTLPRLNEPPPSHRPTQIGERSDTREETAGPRQSAEHPSSHGALYPSASSGLLTAPRVKILRVVEETDTDETGESDDEEETDGSESGPAELSKVTGLETEVGDRAESGSETQSEDDMETGPEVGPEKQEHSRKIQPAGNNGETGRLKKAEVRFFSLRSKEKEVPPSPLQDKTKVSSRSRKQARRPANAPEEEEDKSNEVLPSPLPDKLEVAALSPAGMPESSETVMKALFQNTESQIPGAESQAFALDVIRRLAFPDSEAQEEPAVQPGHSESQDKPPLTTVLSGMKKTKAGVKEDHVAEFDWVDSQVDQHYGARAGLGVGVTPVPGPKSRAFVSGQKRSSSRLTQKGKSQNQPAGRGRPSRVSGKKAPAQRGKKTNLLSQVPDKAPEPGMIDLPGGLDQVPAQKPTLTPVPACQSPLGQWPAQQAPAPAQQPAPVQVPAQQEAVPAQQPPPVQMPAQQSPPVQMPAQQAPDQESPPVQVPAQQETDAAQQSSPAQMPAQQEHKVLNPIKRPSRSPAQQGKLPAKTLTGQTRGKKSTATHSPAQQTPHKQQLPAQQTSTVARSRGRLIGKAKVPAVRVEEEKPRGRRKQAAVQLPAGISSPIGPDTQVAMEALQMMAGAGVLADVRSPAMATRSSSKKAPADISSPPRVATRSCADVSTSTLGEGAEVSTDISNAMEMSPSARRRSARLAGVAAMDGDMVQWRGKRKRNPTPAVKMPPEGTSRRFQSADIWNRLQKELDGLDQVTFRIPGAGRQPARDSLGAKAGDSTPESRGRVSGRFQEGGREVGMVKVLFSHSLSGTAVRSQSKILKKLQGSVATEVRECSHFVAEKFARTANMMTAVAAGKHVVSPAWLTQCGRRGAWLDPDPFVLEDSEKEQEFGFSLRSALLAARVQPALQGCTFFVSERTNPARTVVRAIAETAGARLATEKAFLASLNRSEHRDRFIAVGCVEDKATVKRLQKKGVVVYSVELLMSAILHQRLDFTKNKLDML